MSVDTAKSAVVHSTANILGRPLRQHMQHLASLLIVPPDKFRILSGDTTTGESQANGTTKREFVDLGDRLCER